MKERYVGAIDQGTTSTRFMIFDSNGLVVANEQKEHEQITPLEGYIEHDLMELWNNTMHVMTNALSVAGISGNDLAAIGIANQRETTAVWDM